MKEEENSKLKYGIIISIIGIIISIICMVGEIIAFKIFPFFWVIIFICNVVILVSNLYEYRK